MKRDESSVFPRHAIVLFVMFLLSIYVSIFVANVLN